MCRGVGATAYARAIVVTRYGAQIRGYEVQDCTVCDGRGWLPGMVAPT
jgi:hypothetical protein